MIPEALASLALFCLCAAAVAAQNGAASSLPEPSYGSLVELAGKRNVLLLVRRTAVVDAGGGRGAMIEEALRADPRQSRRYRLAYNTIARKLNKFMSRYKTMSAVGRMEEADYIIFFNLLEYRRPLGVPYPYGELFVIVNSQPGTRDGSGGPRVVWQSKKVQWAGDAVDDLLDDLRAIR